MKQAYDRQIEREKYEVELLSLMINDDSLYTKSIDIIRAEMFTGINRQIFEAYKRLVAKSVKPDAVNISDESNIEYWKVIEIVTHYSGIGNSVDSLLHDLYEAMCYDKYIKLAAFIGSNVTAGSDSELIKDQILSELRSIEFGNSASVITMEQGVSDVYKIIENNRMSVHCTGIACGLKIIDNFMGGLQNGDLIILAGETSHGKTSLALSMMYNSSVMFGNKCGIISHEMTPVQITARLSAMATGLSSKLILSSKMTDSEISLFSMKVNTLMQSNILIQDFIQRDISNTLSAIRLMAIQHGIKWVVVENAGNITVKGKNDHESRTAEISTSLKSLAKELNIPIILISHLNRSNEGKKQPDLTRLRHSGQLEQDADVVMFIYRPELHGFKTFNEIDSDDSFDDTAGRCKVYISKGRNIGTVKTLPYFNSQTTYVSDYSTQNEARNDYNPNEYQLPTNPTF